MILKLEPYSGISGDMFLGALAPLLHAEALIEALPAQLGLTEVTVHFEDVVRSTIRCRKAQVLLRGAPPESPDHDHHAHDHDHDHAHNHDHDHDHAHSHDHGHDHTHTHDHVHAHRAYTDIVQLIENADLPSGAKSLSLNLFKKLGESESVMHGIPLAEVHFHEVGGEDAIVDLVGAALLLDLLKPEAVYCTPVCVGSGFVKTAHGRLPVPAPATQKLLQGFPTFAGPVAKEMTTPTGAAILSVLNPNFDIPTLIVDQSSMGAGSRDLDQPNALRASLGRPAAENSTEPVTLLETNLDNLTGEDLGADLLQDLLDRGALDAWLTPILMKKGRPAHQLQLLCLPGLAVELSHYILTTLPTLGVRQFEGVRSKLAREVRVVSTPAGVVEVKVHLLPDGSERYFPEYESCKLAAEASGLSVAAVRHMTRSAASPSG